MPWYDEGSRAVRGSYGGTLLERAYIGTTQWYQRMRGATFAQSNDYASRGGGLTGASDGKRLTFSVWLDPSDDATARSVFQGITPSGSFFPFISVQKDGGGRIKVEAQNGAGPILIAQTPTSAVTASGGWHHVMGCFDLSDTGKRFIYVNGVSQTLTVSGYLNQNMDWTLADWHIGYNTFIGSGGVWSGGMAELWVNNSYIDLSNSANRLKFLDSDGFPEFLGDDGSRPTGSAPIIFLSGKSASWMTNKGSGGGFTSAGGSLDESTTDPHL